MRWVTERYDLPSWSTIVVVERPAPEWRPEHEVRPVSAAEFDERFEQILALGHRDWVNVGFAGIDGQALVVAVEYFTEPLPDGFHFRRDQISINLSGPERRQGIPEKRSHQN